MNALIYVARYSLEEKILRVVFPQYYKPYCIATTQSQNAAITYLNVFYLWLLIHAPLLENEIWKWGECVSIFFPSSSQNWNIFSTSKFLEVFSLDFIFTSLLFPKIKLLFLYQKIPQQNKILIMLITFHKKNVGKMCCWSTRLNWNYLPN